MTSGLLIILAGYCNSSTIPRSTQLWVAALRQHSQHLVIVFDNPPPCELPTDWHGNDLSVVFERHGGYDFGSYQRGLNLAIEQGLLKNANHVLFCNDSVLAPLGDLGSLLSRMQAKQDEAWGMTASLQQTPHLQSYFVLTSKRLLDQPSLQNFFSSITPQINRHTVIQRYELGLSRALIAAGARLRAVVEPQQLLDPRSGHPAGNPTAFPLSLIDLGVPLMKARALREQNANQEGVHNSCRMLAERNPDLWKAVWHEHPRRRWLRQQVQIGIVLSTTNRAAINNWLRWSADQSHPNVQTLIPVAIRAHQQWAQLLANHKHAIEDGHLHLLRVDPSAPAPVQLQQMLAASQVDWICQSADCCTSSRTALGLQAERIAQHPNCHYSPGPPCLWQREWLVSNTAEALRLLNWNMC